MRYASRGLFHDMAPSTSSKQFAFTRKRCWQIASVQQPDQPPWLTRLLLGDEPDVAPFAPEGELHLFAELGKALPCLPVQSVATVVYEDDPARLQPRPHLVEPGKCGRVQVHVQQTHRNCFWQIVVGADVSLNEADVGGMVDPKDRLDQCQIVAGIQRPPPRPLQSTSNVFIKLFRHVAGERVDAYVLPFGAKLLQSREPLDGRSARGRADLHDRTMELVRLDYRVEIRIQPQPPESGRPVAINDGHQRLLCQPPGRTQERAVPQ